MLKRAWSLWIALVLACAALPAGAAPTQFLDPQQAFQFSAHMVNPSEVEVHYAIAKGYYLYRERFHFSAEPASVTLGEPVFPKGEIKFDETFNKNVEHYRNEVTVRIPVHGTGPFTLVSTAQGCADAGLCYPPQEARASLTAGGGGGASSTTPAQNPDGGAVAAAADTAAKGTSFSSVQDALASGNLLWIAVLFVGLGLGLAFTPCVLPMVPILSSIIADTATESDPGRAALTGTRRILMDKAKGLILSIAYSLGMALVYTGLGVAAGLAGEGLAAALQTPAALWTFATVLVLLAFSSFGFYDLQIPSGMQARLAHWCGRAEGGQIAGVFIMGALSALIVGPCVAPPLAATLLYISQTRNGWIGGVALFSMAVGMSVPLIVMGISEGALLPKTGPWMESVKRFFGILLIGVAIWIVSPVLPGALQMVAWGALFIVSSVYLRVFDSLPPNASGWARFWKGAGVLLLLVGAIQIIGVATGGHDVLEPLGTLAARSGTGPSVSQPTLAFTRVHSSEDLDARLKAANRPVMLVFSADWCVACHELERFTFSDQRVAQRLSQYEILEADVTANNADDRALMKRFSLFGPPGILFFDGTGQPVPRQTVIGFMDADRFLQRLDQAKG